ncbi:MAG: hypothetical protein HRU04_18435 [Oceanospirillaceae bacterium]|nr:hypothetical protein [Oceanospirillaceae bacterium]
MTRRAITQRIGLTESSVRTISDITRALRSVAEIDYSRPMVIRRAVEVYAEYLLELHNKGLLHTEIADVDALQGQRGRRATQSSRSATACNQYEGGI